ncbi:MAG: hypothetical protein JXR88_12415 [Clostridia bacterium]|nr:hypothetical protein [Clostridia bacterium]
MKGLIMSSNTKVYNMFIEVRYQPSMLFENLPSLNTIQKILLNDFQNANYDQSNKVLIFNGSNGINVNIFNNRVTLHAMMNVDINKFDNVAKKTLKIVLNELDVSFIDRIGIRGNWGLVIDEYEKGEKYFFNELFNSKGILAPFFRDAEKPRMGFSKRFNDYNINLNFGVGNIQESGLGPNGVISKNENIIDIDIDVYNQVRLSKDLLSTRITEFLKYHEEYANEFFSKIRI